MPVAIAPLGLGRVRRTDSAPQVTINGSGFSAIPGQNQVLVSGSSATIVTESATQITFNLPFPFSAGFIYEVRSIHVPLIVVNQTTGERSTDAWIFIPEDFNAVADAPIDTAHPGPFEIASLGDVAERFEARDMQRLAALLEALVWDLSPGNVLAWDGTKLAEPAGLKGSGAGQILVVDASEPTGLKWGFKLDAALEFGGTITWPAVTVLLSAGATMSGAAPNSDENWALDDGTVDLIWLRGRSSAGGLLDRVRLLVDGVALYDSGAGLATVDYYQAISVAVTKGQKLQLETTRSGGVGSSIGLVGGVRQLVE